MFFRNYHIEAEKEIARLDEYTNYILKIRDFLPPELKVELILYCYYIRFAWYWASDKKAFKDTIKEVFISFIASKYLSNNKDESKQLIEYKYKMYDKYFNKYDFSQRLEYILVCTAYIKKNNYIPKLSIEELDKIKASIDIADLHDGYKESLGMAIAYADNHIGNLRLKWS